MVVLISNSSGKRSEIHITWTVYHRFIFCTPSNTESSGFFFFLHKFTSSNKQREQDFRAPGKPSWLSALQTKLGRMCLLSPFCEMCIMLLLSGRKSLSIKRSSHLSSCAIFSFFYTVSSFIACGDFRCRLICSIVQFSNPYLNSLSIFMHIRQVMCDFSDVSLSGAHDVTWKFEFSAKGWLVYAKIEDTL